MPYGRPGCPALGGRPSPPARRAGPAAHAGRGPVAVDGALPGHFVLMTLSIAVSASLAAASTDFLPVPMFWSIV